MNARMARGAAAVEMAILLPVMLLLLVFPLLLGRAFWHYAVIQSAAQDAALYLSTVPLGEMNTAGRSIRAADLARDIVLAETAELAPGTDWPVSITVQCDTDTCDFGVPVTISVVVKVRIFDPVFGDMTISAVGEDGLILRTKVEMRYVGQ